MEFVVEGAADAIWLVRVSSPTAVPREAQDPRLYGAAVNGPEGEAWKASVSDEGKSLYKHDVCLTR